MAKTKSTRSAESLSTTDHDTIRQWAEQRGGKPSAVIATESGDDVGIIRIDFPGYSGEGSLEEISWDDFFEKFDDSGLALLYQENTADGQQSNFNKLVKRTTAAKKSKATKRAAKKTATKKTAKKSTSKKTVAKKSAKKSAGKKVAKKSVKRSS